MQTPKTSVAATIIIGMRLRIIGRTLGIGFRVAGRVVGQRVAESAQNGAAPPTGVVVQAQAVRNEVTAASRDARQEAQKAALRSLVKTPLVYTSVTLRNWRAFYRLGIAGVRAPGRRLQA